MQVWPHGLASYSLMSAGTTYTVLKTALCNVLYTVIYTVLNNKLYPYLKGADLADLFN